MKETLPEGVGVCMDVRVKKLDPEARLPQPMSPGASGADVFSVRAYVLPAGGTMVIRTGIAIEIPEGYEGQMRTRSGLALEHQVVVLPSPGTIDSDFRGEVAAVMHNFGKVNFSIAKYDRIAQLVIAPVEKVSYVEADEIAETDRGEEGFGSTGVGDPPSHPIRFTIADGERLPKSPSLSFIPRFLIAINRFLEDSYWNCESFSHRLPDQAQFMITQKDMKFPVEDQQLAWIKAVQYDEENKEGPLVELHGEIVPALDVVAHSAVYSNHATAQSVFHLKAVGEVDDSKMKAVTVVVPDGETEVIKAMMMHNILKKGGAVVNRGALMYGSDLYVWGATFTECEERCSEILG